MSEDRYLVMHNKGSDPGWTMLVLLGHGRHLVNIEVARKKAEDFVRQHTDAEVLIVEAAFTVKTEYPVPPIRVRRFK